MSTAAKPEPGQPGGDPSMEDILASIRRILSEDEQAPTGEPETPDSGDEDVLVLDPSMMVVEPAPEPEKGEAAPSPPATTPPPPEPQTAVALPAEPGPETALVSPESARAAAASVAGLVAKLVSERATQTHTGGPTIEDLVRAELRPLLKAWLDTHLPPLVERLVRAEIERVIGRT